MILFFEFLVFFDALLSSIIAIASPNPSVFKLDILYFSERFFLNGSNLSRRKTMFERIASSTLRPRVSTQGQLGDCLIM